MISDQQLEWLSKKLSEAATREFTGNIQINWFKGNISNIVVQESFKPSEE